MQNYKQDKSPFDKKIPVNGEVTWLKPVLVAEVKYSEITRDGILRHPVFLHLREDKKPSEVKPDEEEVAPVPSSSKKNGKVKSTKASKDTKETCQGEC
jgi:bifunctional non-homologous end joining protein LigD